MRLQQIYAHYLKWEDFQHGQFMAPEYNPAKSLECQQLLSDPRKLLVAMRRVTNEWPVASAVNLSNNSINRQAWLGQAACCLLTGASEHITKTGWRQMQPPEQVAANLIADSVISEWEIKQCQKLDWELMF